MPFSHVVRGNADDERCDIVRFSVSVCVPTDGLVGVSYFSHSFAGGMEVFR